MARSLGNKTRSRKEKNGKTVRRKNEGIVVGREREDLRIHGEQAIASVSRWNI